MGQELRNVRDTGTYAGRLTGEIIDNGIRIYDFMAIYLQTKLLVDNFTGEEHIIADGLARGEDPTIRRKPYADVLHGQKPMSYRSSSFSRSGAAPFAR